VTPKPYYQDDAVTIYHGDCREILPLVTADVVVTDPPYGLGKRMSGGTWGTAEKYAEMWRWDVAPALELLLRLIAIGDSIIWGGHYFGLPPSRCWLIWDKRNAVPTTADCEMAWTNLDRPTKRFSAPVGVHEFGHPTQKPIALMRWSLSFVPTGVILDPFMGSGTTLRAAKDLNRRAIGIEIEERYCEIAAKRCAQEVFDLGEAA
jgi:DNA modification methylase